MSACCDGYFTFDVTTFRVQYPSFSNATLFPDVVLQQYWDAATCYISNSNYGNLGTCCTPLALNLMTAHLTQLSTIIANGQVPYLMQNATIDKVSVGLTPPPVPNQWQWWLNQTAYGQQLLALLKALSVGGFYAGGLPERDAFRKVYGTFASQTYSGGQYQIS